MALAAARFVTLGKSSLASERAVRAVCNSNPLIFGGSGRTGRTAPSIWSDLIYGRHSLAAARTAIASWVTGSAVSNRELFEGIGSAGFRSFAQGATLLMPSVLLPSCSSVDLRKYT